MKFFCLALCLALLSSFCAASYLVELTYSNGVVTQAGVYYTNAEASSPGGNLSYSIGGATGSLDFPRIQMHDAKNNESMPASYSPMTRILESTAFIIVPDSAIPATGTANAENLKIMNGTQVLLDEPLKSPTRLVPSVAPQAGQTTQTTGSTETVTPGTTQGSDDGAGLDLFFGLIIGAVIVVAILIFLRKKGKK